MNRLSTMFEEFQPVSHVPVAPPACDVDHDALQAEAFALGFEAGKVAAEQAAAERQDRLSADLVQHVQDLSFTYNEAFGEAVRQALPILSDLVDHVLPEIARIQIAGHVTDLIRQEVQPAMQPQVQLRAHPDCAMALRPALDREFGFPIVVQPDDALAPLQVELSFGQQERDIDLTALLAAMREILRTLETENERLMAHE